MAGAVAGRRLRLPGGALLAPMIVAAVVTLGVPGGEFEVPRLLRELAFALIGLQVGLRFTLDTIRQLGRLLVPVLLAVLGVLAACGLLAVVLDVTTAVSLRDAYLADHARWAVRGARRRARRRCERRLHPRRAGPAADRDGRAGARRRALDGGAGATR